MVRGLWFLLHYQYWVLTESPLGYPVVVLCHGDPATLDLQDWLLHTLQQIIDGGCWDGPIKALVLGQGGCWVGQSASSPSSSPLG